MKKIVVLPGDGIGPEIMQSALHILEVASKNEFDYEIQTFPFGGASIDKHNTPLMDSVIEGAQNADAILLGAIGGPQWEDAAVTPEMGLLALRKKLGLFANLRPIDSNEAFIDHSPLKASVVSGTNMLIVRELTGGLYFGEPKWEENDKALDTTIYHRDEIERIVHLAFQQAQERKKHLTSVDKANVLATSRLWRRIVNEIAPSYPDVTVEHLYVDAAAMKIITEPARFDVIVTANLFGDILSDEASVITGSLGMLPSASMNASGLGLYEPIHGSAPDIAGKDIANPMSMIYSMTMMLRISFKAFSLAEKIEQVAHRVMEKGILTHDLGGNATMSEFTNAIIKELEI